MTHLYRLRARVASLLTLRVAFWLMALSSILAGVAAITALQAQRDTSDQNDRLTQVVADLKAENLARREAACNDANESRAVIRELSKGGDLEVGESIIEVASADPEVVAQFRDILGRRLTANVNQLPGRRWDARTEECVDVEVGG